MLRPHFLFYRAMYPIGGWVLRALLIGQVCGNYTEKVNALLIFYRTRAPSLLQHSTRPPAQSAPAPIPYIFINNNFASR